MPANTNASSGQKPGKSGRRKGRRARLLLIVLVLALVGGFGYGGYWSVSTVRASFPQTSGSITLEGLSGPVDVKRDGYGIPQIYASSDEDLFMAQGYVQAQDRFYEMDVRRHLTSGRLSEMFGKSQVKNDEFLRTLGWDRVAKQEYDTKLSSSTKKYLDAYAKGVNAYLKGKSGKDISLEYAALGLVNDYKPQQWTPVDSVSWLKAMAWDLRGNMQDEIDRSLMTSRLGPKQIDDLYPDYPYSRNKPIVQTGQYNEITKAFEQSGSTGTQSSTGSSTANSSSSALQSQLAGLYNVLDNVPTAVGVNGNGIGSNSWVVDGDHTITRKPLLANDPHLSASLPSVWYQMGLHCTTLSSKCQYDVTGYTFAGMPGVIIGHNKNIAWGMTNSGVDVTDLYLEKLSGSGYLYDNKVRPFTTRTETIKVAGGDSKKIVVRETNNGPLLSDRDDELVKVGKKATVETAAPDRGDGYGIALRWTALDPGTSMDAVFAIDKASNWDEFRSASRSFDVPSQNLVYADTKGNIGYQLPGKIPVRGKGKAGCRAGLGPRVQLDRQVHPAERAALRVQPEAGLHRHREPGGDRQEQVPLPAHRGLGLRHAQSADHRPDRVEDQGRRQDVDRRHAPDPARQLQRHRQAAGAQAPQDRRLRQERPRGAEAARGLGLHTGRRLGGGRVLQRRLAQHPQARLRQQAAQGTPRRGPVPVGRAGRQHRARGRGPEGARVR